MTDWELVGKVRTLCGLSNEGAVAPSVITSLLDDCSGSYSPYYNTVKLAPGSRPCTLWHELCHAYQRPYLQSSEGWRYRESTDYESRWYEKEARVIALLCGLLLAGVKIKTGDHLRVYFGNGLWIKDRYSRSLRKRVNRR